MQIAVVDDCSDDIEELRGMAEQYLAARRFSAGLTLFSSGEAFLSQYRPGRFDILLLDLYMSGMSGMDTARQVRKLSGSCQIVFITSTDAYAVDGYEVEAAGYLIKPVKPETLGRTLDRCIQRMDAGADRYINIVSNRQPLKIPLNSIIWISVQQNALMLHTSGGPLKVYMALRQLTAMLGTDTRFLTCNKGVLINMERVAALDGDDFLMDNSERVPIRKRNVRQLKHEYVQYLCQREAAFLRREELAAEKRYES